MCNGNAVPMKRVVRSGREKYNVRWGWRVLRGQRKSDEDKDEDRVVDDNEPFLFTLVEEDGEGEEDDNFFISLSFFFEEISRMRRRRTEEAHGGGGGGDASPSHVVHHVVHRSRDASMGRSAGGGKRQCHRRLGK